MRSEEVVFEAQAMADLMCCSVADQMEYQAVADVGAHFGIVGGCLQEKPRLELRDDIGIEEHVGLQNLTGTWINPMTAFGVGLLTINTEECIAGEVERIEVVAALAEGDSLQKGREPDGLKSEVPVLDTLSDGILPELGEGVVDVEDDAGTFIQAEPVNVRVFVILIAETWVSRATLHRRLG